MRRCCYSDILRSPDGGAPLGATAGALEGTTVSTGVSVGAIDGTELERQEKCDEGNTKTFRQETSRRIINYDNAVKAQTRQTSN